MGGFFKAGFKVMMLKEGNQCAWVMKSMWISNFFLSLFFFFLCFCSPFSSLFFCYSFFISFFLFSARLGPLDLNVFLIANFHVTYAALILFIWIWYGATHTRQPSQPHQIHSEDWAYDHNSTRASRAWSPKIFVDLGPFDMEKNWRFNIHTPQAQGSSLSTWVVVHRELGFKYQDSIRVA